jgi:hypothetical protein
MILNEHQKDGDLDILAANSSFRAGLLKLNNGKTSFWLVGLEADVVGISKLAFDFLTSKFGAVFYRKPLDVFSLAATRHFRIGEVVFTATFDYLNGLNIWVDSNGFDWKVREIGLALSRHLTSEGTQLPPFRKVIGSVLSQFLEILQNKYVTPLFSSFIFIVSLFYFFANTVAFITINNRTKQNIFNLSVKTNREYKKGLLINGSESVRIQLRRNRLFDVVGVSFVSPHGILVEALGTSWWGNYEFDITGAQTIIYSDHPDFSSGRP